MAQTDSVTFTVETLASGDATDPDKLSVSYTNTNTQAVKSGGISVGTGAFEDVIGAFNETTGAYLIENTDATNFITLKVFETGGDTTYLKLPAGAFYFQNGTQMQIETTGGAFSAFVNVDSIHAKADSAACVVRSFKVQPA